MTFKPTLLAVLFLPLMFSQAQAAYGPQACVRNASQVQDLAARQPAIRLAQKKKCREERVCDSYGTCRMERICD